MELGKRSWGGEEWANNERVKVTRLQLYKGYMKLEPTAGPEQESLPPAKRSSSLTLGPESKKQQQQQQGRQHQRRKWRLRIRPKVKVVYSTISRLVRRLKDSYAKVIRALVASSRDDALHSLGESKKKPKTADGNGSSIFRFGSGGLAGSNSSVLETKYLDYIKRSATDGELSYYIMTLRSSGIL